MTSETPARTGPPEATGGPARRKLREVGRAIALQSALQKRATGVPSYTIPEAAALCSVSPEHLYRLVKGDAFPAIRMRLGAEQGRYVIPAKAVEQVLNDAAATGAVLDIAEWAKSWTTSRQGGAA